MREHTLKVWPSVFAALLDGSKTFEFRKNDRDFAVGDELALYEWDPTKEPSGFTSEYDRKYVPRTGRSMRARVTYIAHGGRFGIPEGYCVMSIQKVEHVDPRATT